MAPSQRVRAAGGGLDEHQRAIQDDVVDMYTRHPSPSHRDKLAFASRRMRLRLECCGIEEQDYIGKQVLDAGCGTGEYSSWFAKHGAHVTGIDLSDGSLAEAREYAETNGLAIDFQKRSVLQTGFADERFDLVYCTGVLHHTPDPFAGLCELHRVLKPGGKILISLYNSFGFYPRAIRRRIVQLIAGRDLDERVRWGCRLFPIVSKRLVRNLRNDPQSALYDYFAIPHESLHSVGRTLRWFDRLQLEYLGSFAPVSLGDYLVLFGREGAGSADRRLENRAMRRLGKLIGRRDLARRRPGPLSRLLVQTIWLFTRVGIFCVSGRKPASAAQAQ